MDTAGDDNLKKQWLQRGVLLQLCGGLPTGADSGHHHRKEAGEYLLGGSRRPSKNTHNER